MAKKSKQEPVSTRDMLLRYLSIAGALFTLPLVVPQLPWRRANQDSNLGARFSSIRVMSPFTVTNNMQQGITWFKLGTEVCNQVLTFNTPNPIKALVGTVASLVGAGGSVQGCATWTICKNHAAQRCTAYRSLAYVGILCIMLILIGSCCSMLTVVCLSLESMKRKKKEKEEAAQKTMVVSILSFALTFMGVVAWFLFSDRTFKGLKSSGYYPYPAASVGLYLGAIAIFTLLGAMYCGVTRVHPVPSLFKRKEAEEEEEYVDMMYPGMPMPPDMYGAGGMPLPDMYGGQPGAPSGMAYPMMGDDLPPGMGSGGDPPSFMNTNQEAQGDGGARGMPSFMQ